MTETDATELRAGVIGLGQMGRGIALNLHKAGLLHGVWDSRDSALEPFSALPGAPVAASPRVLGESCDVIVLVVPSSAEVCLCLDGAEGILAVDNPGQTLLDLTTSDPHQTARNVERARARGRAYLDAGMSGGATGADAGQLALMVGGDTATFDRCAPLFAAIADMDRVRHVGPSGSGHTMKLVHNMICHTVFMATAEGCRLAERAGIDLATAISVINGGNARSYASEQRFVNHILSGTWNGRSTVSNLEKDLRMGVEMAQRFNAQTRFSSQTAALLARAVAAGMKDDDFTLIYRNFDQLAD